MATYPTPPADVTAAFQRLHEQAHPGGTLYIENCREPECRAVAEAYGLRPTVCAY